DRWLSVSPNARVYVPRVWERFVPHFCKPGKSIGRIVGIPDAGQRIRIGECELIALPAHFLHAEGNFQFYDPVSRILFSGDLGTSIVGPQDAKNAITSLATHRARMEAFHRRYMVSNKVLRFWAKMVRGLPIDMVVPQHGAPLTGAAIHEFIEWVESLPCGIDLMNESNYAIPA
ncbi:MAG: MBL fold metallo-hydrolase, partial [Burkholderiaceae bacterium]